MVVKINKIILKKNIFAIKFNCKAQKKKKVERQLIQENSNNLFGLKVTTERHAMPIKGKSKSYCF